MAKEYNGRITFTYEGKRYDIKAATEKEAIIKQTNKLRDLREKKQIINSQMTVEQWSKQCVSTYKTNLVKRSYTDYVQRLNNNVINYIGHMRLSDVKPIDCQNVLNYLVGKSKTHIDKVYQSMFFIFDKAVDNDLLLKNPATKVQKPKGYVNSHRALTDTERKYVLDVAEYNRAGTWVLTMLFCGLRPSETINITGKDFQKKDYGYVLTINGTKTSNAVRTVPVPSYLWDRLPKVSPNESIFKDAKGNPIKDYSLKNLWNSFKRDMNIAMGCKVYRQALVPPFPVESDLTPYCFRHTYCTDLCKNGIDIRIAQKFMGHSTISLTADIYTHMTQSEFMNASEKIQAGAMQNTPKNSTPISTPKHTKAHQNT